MGPLGEAALIEEGSLAPAGYDPTPSPLDSVLAKVAATIRAQTEESRLDRLEARNEAAQAKDRAKARKKKGE